MSKRIKRVIVCYANTYTRGIDRVTTFTAGKGKRTDISRRMGKQPAELTE